MKKIHSKKEYIARDSDGHLYRYTNRPVKDDRQWIVNPNAKTLTVYSRINKTWFPNVKWENKKPTKVIVTIELI